MQRHKRRKPSVRNVHHVDEENLEGENWLATPWVPPSVAKAHKHRSRYVYRGGQASVCFTSVKDMSSVVGIGMGLYFRYLKYLAIAFFIMSLLALPVLLINTAGRRVTEEERDALSISMTSLGNNGLPDEMVQARERECETGDCEQEWVVDVLGNTIKASTASLIIAVCDLLYSVFFLCFARFFHNFIIKVGSCLPGGDAVERVVPVPFPHRG